MMFKPRTMREKVIKIKLKCIIFLYVVIKYLKIKLRTNGDPKSNHKLHEIQ